MNTEVLYEVKINGEVFDTDKPVLSGKDLLKMAGKEPLGEFVIYLLLEDGDMENIRPAEVVDLQRSGLEKFRTFKSDVIYRLEVNDKSREWGSDVITGRAIKRLAGIDAPGDVGIWQKTKCGEDKLIGDRDLVDLACEGIEKFRVGAKYSVCIEGKIFEWSKGNPPINNRS